MPWKQGQISGPSVTKLLRLGGRSRRTDAHQKAHRWQRSRTRPVASRLALLESVRFRRPFRLEKKHPNWSRLILSASPGAGSMDWPGEERQIVPTPENNE